MSAMFKAALHELVYDAPAWRRYPVLIVKTIAVIRKNRPEIIFAQNPSLLLAGLSVLLGKLFSIPVIIDAHNAGLFPLEGKSKGLNQLASFINNRAATVIVSNDKLKDYVQNSGGRAFVVPDPVPTITCAEQRTLREDSFNIVFVCSWADDEPYAEVIRMANDLDNSICIYMTGNSKGRASEAGIELPDNVVLTGFLKNSEYEALLCECDAVMVLTKRDDCLVCGAYEGVAVEKPMILSNTCALKTFFYDGCVYAENTQDGLKEAVNSLLEKRDELSKDVRQFKVCLKEAVAKQISDMEQSVLNDM
ncbi:MAG: hypothetical protein QM500_21575 [Methylococcales bacterium]